MGVTANQIGMLKTVVGGLEDVKKRLYLGVMFFGRPIEDVAHELEVGVEDAKEHIEAAAHTVGVRLAEAGLSESMALEVLNDIRRVNGAAPIELPAAATEVQVTHAPGSETSTAAADVPDATTEPGSTSTTEAG